MKTKILSGLAILCLLFGLGSCKKGYDKYVKNPVIVYPEDLRPQDLGFLFSKAESAASYTSGNYQIAQNLFSDLYSQYFALTATYFPSDRYVMRDDWLQAHWTNIYTQAVPQLKGIMAVAGTETPENALARVVWVYAFHRLTDYYGPVPYFQAGQPLSSVPYDAQDKIYDDLFKQLDTAVITLKANPTAAPFGSFDLIYGGDVTKWLKFANTLRLRLALRVSKVTPDRAKSEAEKAVADGVLEDVADDAYMKKNNSGDESGLAIISQWNEFRMSASMESVLKGYNDPRLQVYYQPATATGTFEGVRNGLLPTQQNATVNTADHNSNVGTKWEIWNGTSWVPQLTAPQNILHSAEAYFLRAEGAMNGWAMGGTPEDFYNKGIEMSMKEWGITDGSAITAYQNSLNTPVAPGDFLSSPALTNIPVKWGGTEGLQREQIATQKWIGLYPDGMEAWADFRRSRLVKLYHVVNSDNTEVPATDYIRRIHFLTIEKQSNAVAVKAAEALLGGPDLCSTPLWWDKN